MPKVLVCRDQNVEGYLGGIEKLSVRRFRPSHFEGGTDGVPDDASNRSGNQAPPTLPDTRSTEGHSLQSSMIQRYAAVPSPSRLACVKQAWPGDRVGAGDPVRLG
jgi:hypothetical protein